MNSGNPLFQSGYKRQKLDSIGGSMKVDISKEELKELYLEKKLTTYQIAKIYRCWDSTVGYKLKEVGISRRDPKKKKVFSKKVLQELYLSQGLSVSRIAKKLNCGHATIWHRLKEYKIPTRKLKRYRISKRKLSELYFDEKLSQNQIADKLNCSAWVISDKFDKFGFQKRNISEVNQIYDRNPFSEDLIEKAYLIGFRIGDLHVERKSKYSIRVGSNTTRPEQIDLMCSLFEKYAHVQVSQSEGVFCFSCLLNNSFSFLEPKDDLIEYWILNDDEMFFSFLAGYTDAEGNIGVYSGRARYRVGSYEKNILFQIHNKLTALGFRTRIRLELPKGYKSNGIVNNGDFWRVSINYKDSLLRLFKQLEQYLKHEKRIRDLKNAKENVMKRLT